MDLQYLLLLRAGRACVTPNLINADNCNATRRDFSTVPEHDGTSARWVQQESLHAAAAVCICQEGKARLMPASNITQQDSQCAWSNHGQPALLRCTQAENQVAHTCENKAMLSSAACQALSCIAACSCSTTDRHGVLLVLAVSHTGTKARRLGYLYNTNGTATVALLPDGLITQLPQPEHADPIAVHATFITYFFINASLSHAMQSKGRALTSATKAETSKYSKHQSRAYSTSVKHGKWGNNVASHTT